MPPVELTAAARVELARERDRITEQLPALARTAGLDSWSDATADVVDAGSASSEREIAEVQLVRARTRLEQVTDALARIDAGTWGICAECGEAIADERLEALPATEFCVTHAQRR